jgi:uncharacterized membrane protein
LSNKPEEPELNKQQQEKSEDKLEPQPPQKLQGYLTSDHAFWYWITMTLTIVTPIVVFTVPENMYPLAYIRSILGAIFVVWLPGYTFIKALFPTSIPFTKKHTASNQTSEKNQDLTLRIILTIGMSLVLVSITGLLLNYTPWGLRLTPVVLSLLPLIIIFATAAIIREYQSQTRTH